jgi:hypothetical protein
MSKKNENSGRFWMMLPVLLLGGSVLGWIVMVRSAVADPSFATEPNYYQKAVRFDADRAAQEASEALGWKLRVESFERRAGASRLQVSVKDLSGAPVSGLFGEALGFPNARAMNLSNFVFRELRPGLYEATVAGGRAGLWEVRFAFTKEGKKLLSVVRADLSVSPEGV